MTEKHYGGITGHRTKGKVSHSSSNDATTSKTSKSQSQKSKPDNNSLSEYDNYIKAGKILKQTVEYAKSLVKSNMSLLEIANNIESKIVSLGGKPAFPVNLSINEIAAHSTPEWNDTSIASGLLKVDIGVHIEGCAADTSFSVDLENSEENKKLIKAAEEALSKAVSIANLGENLSAVGEIIEKTIKSSGFQPIQNLSGHSIEKYNLHAGIVVPNFNNSTTKTFEEGVYAIEPFATNGFGAVRDGKKSGIYHLEKQGNVRDSFAREVLAYIAEEYSTLPFCSRWIHKKFGTRGLLALRQIEQAGLLHHYAQLIEKNNGKVAQAEHTIILTKKEKIITTA